MPPPSFLLSALSPPNKEQEEFPRPAVTLTFAQSIDAKIAGKHGKQLILSCNESMITTHWLRSMHDAILVGIGTAINDNPQLNTRLLPQPDQQSPCPIILDRNLRCPPDCKLLKNYANQNGRQPWIFASEVSKVSSSDRATILETAGARIFYIPEDDQQKLQLTSLLDCLHELNVKSLIVEGGATVIDAFLSQPQLVANLIITIAPTIVGDQGLGYSCGDLLDFNNKFHHHSTQIVGRDSVVCMKAAAAGH